MSWRQVREISGIPPQIQEYIKVQGNKEYAPFAVVVFEYQESKTPPESATGGSRLDRRVVETFQWWAQLREIANAQNVVLLSSEFMGGIAPQLHDPSKGIIPIHVPLPDRDGQKSTLRALVEEGVSIAKKNGDVSQDEVAGLLAGLSRVEVRQVFREMQAHDERISLPTLFDRKAKIIEARLGDLVRLVKPPWGWEAIGGMDDRVAIAMQWAEAMRRGRIDVMPKGGVMLIGAPGKGKTVYVEAFAHELDIPLLEVMSTMDQFVGMSERRMQLLLDTSWAMRPCILFFDEFEQLVLPRGSVYHGDSGVFARTLRMLMQFFSDPKIHGQVIPFAATNRPDIVDTAVKRAGRFGAKIPFLIPQKELRPSIFQALFRKEVTRLGLMGIQLDISEVVDNQPLLHELSEMADFWEDGKGVLRCGPPGKTILDPESDTIKLTGAEMEECIALALQPRLAVDDAKSLCKLLPGERSAFFQKHFSASGKMAKLTPEGLRSALHDRLLPHEDVAAYRYMNELALKSVNDLDLIPVEYRDTARKLRLAKSRQRAAIE